MPDSGDNIRFQVLVNSEVRGTAGMEAIGGPERHARLGAS
jgi:hypothetical protein